MQKSSKMFVVNSVSGFEGFGGTPLPKLPLGASMPPSLPPSGFVTSCGLNMLLKSCWCLLWTWTTLYACEGLYWICHDQHGDRGWNRTNIPIDINPFITHPVHEKLYHTTGVYAPHSLHLTRNRTVKDLWDKAYGFLSLSEKTRMSNHL